MKTYLDRKIDLMLDFLRKEEDPEEVEQVIRDIQRSYETARHRADDLELYRTRCNRLLICSSIAKKRVNGESRAYLDSLEGALLEVLRSQD